MRGAANRRDQLNGPYLRLTGAYVLTTLLVHKQY